MTLHPTFLHDQPAEDDAFGREPFAKSLACSLVLPNNSPGLVVGIEGEWGSGKSTLIGFITKHLRANQKAIVIDFNPWMVSTTGALVETLIEQIAVSIGKKVTRGKKGIDASQKLINFVRLLKPLKYIPALSWAGHIAEDVTEAAQVNLDDIKKLLPDMDLAQKKNDVINALKKLDHPIIVVIDDLDRLPAEEVRTMIQAIKAVADFPQITYLLAYDPGIIARALTENEKSGLSYLEKIVQVAYPLPPLSRRQLKRFADEKTRDLLKQLEIDLQSYENDRYEEAIILFTQLSRHPRDVIRITNRLCLSLPATKGEVNTADVIAFEALTQRFPAIRKAVLEHSADFTGHFFRGDLISKQYAFDWGVSLGSREDEAEHTWLKHLPKDNEHDLQIANKTCLFLFEKKARNGVDDLRIADPDQLARLLSLTSIEEVPEVKDIHKLLMEPEELEKKLNRADSEEKLFLLNWLSTYAPSCDERDIKGCINKLTKISQKLTSDSLLTKELAHGISDLMIRLLRLLEPPNYEQCFQDIASNLPLSISMMVLSIAEKNQGNQATKTWSDQVRKSIRENNLLQEIYLHLILHRFTQLNDNDNSESYAAIDQMCKTEEGLAAFRKIFTQESFGPATNELMRGIIQSIKGKDESSLEISSHKEVIKLIEEQQAKLKMPEAN
ncbi:KAP family P-loop NTPase fold protein [Nitrosomonas oligotropha]|uniref:KAP family P-loop domain-containing protein n=1 Tax=Nitrosomonas oligotropha TaxID=42354 RepID=A0A1H8LDG5_9PROT|nr:KAP family NTPase [Nitrosomonas oligotropha]SDW21892.1 KAP family P-loop domain-containing protein [Nitrosomonas oligotropha]SEO02768.1 KAP family P-loop domain-containing protein [Nitrosomonas oligotropha]